MARKTFGSEVLTSSDVNTRLVQSDTASISSATIQAEADTIAVTTAQTQNTKAITFPAAFAATPVVFLTGQDATLRVIWRVSVGPSTTGFTVNVASCDGANFPSNQTLAFAWLAVG